MENENAGETQQQVESPSTETQDTAKSSADTQPQTGSAGEEKQAKERSYSEKEVSDIVSKRVNEWNTLGKPDELKARLARLEQLEKAFKPDEEKQPEQDPQQKAVKEYLETIYPELRSLGQFQSQFQAQLQAAAEAVTRQNLDGMGKLITEAGLPKEVLPFIDGAIANSIRSVPEDAKKYASSGDFEIIKKHFDLIKTGFLSRIGAIKNAQYEDKKEGTKKLPPQTPKGGVAAPTSKQKKLTDAERRAAAFELLSSAKGE